MQEILLSKIESRGCVLAHYHTSSKTGIWINSEGDEFALYVARPVMGVYFRASILSFSPVASMRAC